MLSQIKPPATVVSNKLNFKLRTLAAAIHVPAVDAVTFDRQKLHEIHIDVGAGALMDGFGNVERADPILSQSRVGHLTLVECPQWVESGGASVPLRRQGSSPLR
jgi:hypothetical protein